MALTRHFRGSGR